MYRKTCIGLGAIEKKAVEYGASAARIIPARMISVEDEIVELCKPPLCEGYGKSAHCPPNVISPREAREWIGQFKKALLFKINVPGEILLGESQFEIFRKVYEIASELEGFLIEAGYSLAKGFAAGSCKPVFCKKVPCRALINRGSCRVPSLARPSMEALGMNVFKLVRDAGWEVYPIGRDSDPKEIPQGLLAGLVIVG